MTATQAIVYYHADCADGFGAAWAFNTLRAGDYESVEYVPAKYGDIPKYAELNKETNVYILDFSFPVTELEILCDTVNRVVLIDHHKTAIEMLDQAFSITRPHNLILKLDLNHSGAGLTWDYFTTKPRPALINYIEDRDLWKFALPMSKQINAVIANVNHSFNDYTAINDRITNDFFNQRNIGEHLLVQHQRICESIINNARPITIEDSDGNKYTGLACNCTHQFASDVGNELAKTSGTFGATYFTDKKGDTKFSLRSIGDYDTTTISKSYGGGGHRNASGFHLCGPVCSDTITIWKGVESNG